MEYEEELKEREREKEQQLVMFSERKREEKAAEALNSLPFKNLHSSVYECMHVGIAYMQVYGKRGVEKGEIYER